MNPLAAYKRLASAVERHGARRVIEIVSLTVMRRGLRATIQLAGIQRPFTHRLGHTGPDKPDPASPRERPADLDADYMLPSGRWAPLPPAVGEARAALAFVVDARDGSAEAMARTRAAIQALGGDTTMIEGDSALPRPPADGPDAGRFFVFLKAGDEPSPDLPAAIAEAARGGVAEVVSFDLWRTEGERVQPLLLPGANPTLLRAADYVFSRIGLRGGALPAQIRTDAAPYALALDWLEASGPGPRTRGRWRHVSAPLVKVAVEAGDIAVRREAALAAGRRPIAPHDRDAVSVVICTRDKGHLTRQLVRQLLACDPTLVGEVVIVSNNTANPYALQTLADLEQAPRVRVIRRDEPFNFSRLSNAGVRAAEGRGPLLFLNDDIAPVSEDWLDRLRARLDEEEVGSVGPLLLYPDERVQHAGMFLGRIGGAGHTLRAARLPQEDYLFTACAPREVSALTGAVLLTPRATFEALNGFDEQLATHLQDVDYCLRLRAIGKVNVFEPASVLIHMESASIGALLRDRDFLRGRPAERDRFGDRWGELLQNDPLHPKGFDVRDETLRSLANAARTAKR